MINRIALVCCFAFPNGLAATTRILAYLKGIRECGAQTDVFIYRPTEKWDAFSNLPVDGEIEGVRYHYPNSRKYSRYKIIRVLSRYYHYFVTCYKIWQQHRKSKFDFLIISNDFLDILYLFTILGKIIGLRTIFITDEYPMPIRVYLKNDIPIWKKRLYEIVLGWQDSLVFMTEKLNIFFNSKLKKPYHILPTITDTKRFSRFTLRASPRKYLCYMGNMELSKDNVDNIIRAFSLISDKHKDVDLYLYGAPSSADRSYIEMTISATKMHERVFIKGRVASDEVPGILSNAYVLVSSQPNTKRAEGGFPTKLGEYMATGIPTILTDVGEISQYVKDGQHVNLVPSENPALYSERLDWILSNYEEARAIAMRGQEYLINNFDYKKVSSDFFAFLNSRLLDNE